MAMTPLCLRTLAPPRTFSMPCLRCFSTSSIFYVPPKNTRQKTAKEKAAAEKAKKRRKKHTMYKQHDLKEVEQFSLCDAMRYIQAFEVGRPSRGPKYECHIKLKTKKDGPVVRSQIRLPHSVKTDIKICVICPPDSTAARQAREAGAALVGEDEVFEVLKSGKFDIDRCIAQPESLPKINQAGLGRILGPRGLMPSAKLGTLVQNVAEAVKTMLGGSMYRERQGVVRMAVGQLGFTPEQLKQNVAVFVGKVRKDAGVLAEQVPKDVYEVVLSSTSSPGFSLNGEFRTENSPSVEELSAS